MSLGSVGVPVGTDPLSSPHSSAHDPRLPASASRNLALARASSTRSQSPLPSRVRGASPTRGRIETAAAFRPVSFSIESRASGTLAATSPLTRESTPTPSTPPHRRGVMSSQSLLAPVPEPRTFAALVRRRSRRRPLLGTLADSPRRASSSRSHGPSMSARLIAPTATPVPPCPARTPTSFIGGKETGRGDERPTPPLRPSSSPATHTPSEHL